MTTGLLCLVGGARRHFDKICLVEEARAHLGPLRAEPDQPHNLPSLRPEMPQAIIAIGVPKKAPRLDS